MKKSIASDLYFKNIEIKKQAYIQAKRNSLSALKAFQILIPKDNHKAKLYFLECKRIERIALQNTLINN